MSRRKQSVFEDLIEITSMLPWWAGVGIAVAFYIGLHQVAIMEMVVPTDGKGIGHFVGQQIYKTFAMYLQYIVPALLLIGAAVSAFKRRSRRALHGKVAAAGVKSALERMSWKQFEQLAGEHFRRRGFAVQENEASGADGGVDLVLTRGADHYLVQCKQWRARQVGVAPVRELYGVMAAKGAAGGYVVTSGVFTDEAKRFAEGREIELIDGEQLFGMISAQAETGKPTAARHPNPLPARGKREISPSLDPGSLSGMTVPMSGKTASKSEVPACPECSSPMVPRTARKGSNAGNSFWGCSSFPKCRGIRPV
jgi:restriction system protein